MKFYSCPGCGGRVFFENLVCLSCGVGLGYAAAGDAMLAVDQPSPAGAYRACANRVALSCNWLIDAQTGGDAAPASLCDCCRYTRTLPPLEIAANQQAFAILEQAKRYLFYSLHALRLPIPDRIEQPDTGLAFDFLAQLPDTPRVLTGHDNGIITINVAEADDAKRAQRRMSLHEPYRTVLGHLRHEVGHFYWAQLLENSDLLEEFRDRFGDERQDYAVALQNHYKEGNSGNWNGEFISHYASSHPWEDWAETWAHYLHINDALDTAAAWQITVAIDGASSSVGSLSVAMDVAEYCNRLVATWLPLSQYLNATCRSLGESDAYPFTLPPAVVAKLGFVHRVIGANQAAHT